MTKKVFLIDNFDSFTFNLAYEFESRGCEVEVWRNDIDVNQFLTFVNEHAGPKLIVISPGPGTPKEAGCCIQVIQQAKDIPLFGVCLGHQAIIEAFGGVVERAKEIVHGKASTAVCEGKKYQVGRYHSLVATCVPDCLEVTAMCDDLVMAVRHKERPIIGVQFHPESILTTEGRILFDGLLSD